jgi:hypothetical protein
VPALHPAYLQAKPTCGHVMELIAGAEPQKLLDHRRPGHTSCCPPPAHPGHNLLTN